MKLIRITAYLTVSLLLALCLSCGAADESPEPQNNNGTEAAVTTTAQYLPETPVENELPDDGVYVIYTVNSTGAGHIDGNAEQKLGEGLASTKVTAVPELGYKFVRWSDGVTEATRSGDTLTASAVITAIFNYDILKMPVISIVTETGDDVKSKTEYINADINIINNDTGELSEHTAEIRGRGNNTWGYAKKSYKVKFNDKEQPLGLGEGGDKVWVLLANMCDQSLLRNHFAFELARDLDNILFAPDSVSVEVYLNGEYRGVYLLAEEIKVSDTRVDIDNSNIGTDIGYLIELSAYAQGDWIFRVGNRQYQVRSDLSADLKTAREQFDYIKDYMGDCVKALESGDKAELEKYMDLDAYVDTYLAEEVTKNLDLGWDSYYLHKDKGEKLELGPIWDFDLSYGNSNESCEYYTDIYAGKDTGNNLGNPWYYTASRYEWFRELVRERWNEIYEPILTVLPGEILAEGERGYESYCRNFEKWQIFGTVQNRETKFITSLKNYNEHYHYLSEWVNNRIEWLNDYINSDEYMNGDFVGRKGNNNRQDSEYGNRGTERIMTKYKSLSDKTVFTSANAPGYNGEGPENAFDGDAGTKYCYQYDKGVNEILFETKSAVAVKAYVFRTANDTESNPDRNPDSWVLYGRNSDTAEWKVLDSESDGAANMEALNYTCYGFAIEAPARCRYYKLVIKDSDIVQLSEIILYT